MSWIRPLSLYTYYRFSLKITQYSVHDSRFIHLPVPLPREPSGSASESEWPFAGVYIAGEVVFVSTKEMSLLSQGETDKETKDEGRRWSWTGHSGKKPCEQFFARRQKNKFLGVDIHLSQLAVKVRNVNNVRVCVYARARMYVCVELAHKHTDTHTNAHTHMARRRGNRIKDYKRKTNFTHHKTLHCLDFYAHVSLQLIYYILKRELKINVISRTQTHSYAWQDLRKK